MDKEGKSARQNTTTTALEVQEAGKSVPGRIVVINT